MLNLKENEFRAGSNEIGIFFILQFDFSWLIFHSSPAWLEENFYCLKTEKRQFRKWCYWLFYLSWRCAGAMFGELFYQSWRATNWNVIISTCFSYFTAEWLENVIVISSVEHKLDSVIGPSVETVALTQSEFQCGSNCPNWKHFKKPVIIINEEYVFHFGPDMYSREWGYLNYKVKALFVE